MNIRAVLINTIIGLALTQLAAKPVYAKCNSQKETIFSCATTNGKMIEVCNLSKTVSYSFGKIGSTPELALRIDRNRMGINQWDGSGRYITYGVNIPNGNTTYSVFFAADRHEGHEITAGVYVEIDGKNVATVRCKNPDGIVQNMDVLSLPR